MMGCRDCESSAAQAAWKRAKATLGIDPAPPEVERARRALCRECEHGIQGKRKDGNRWCGQCYVTIAGRRHHCPIVKKTKLNSEHCPLDKW